MRKLVFIYCLFCGFIISALAQESNQLGVYVNEIAIKYVDSLSYYTKVFDCTKLQEVILYQDLDYGESVSWEESLYNNDNMSILFYAPIKDYSGKPDPDKGKNFPLNFTFNSPKYRISINGKQVSVGMSQEDLFELIPRLRSYYETYNKENISPFVVPYYVNYLLYVQFHSDDQYCPIDFTLNNGVVESISIDMRTSDELSGWVEFDCCVKKIK
jgi:hypothetical protein